MAPHCHSVLKRCTEWSMPYMVAVPPSSQYQWISISGVQTNQYQAHQCPWPVNARPNRFLEWNVTWCSIIAQACQTVSVSVCLSNTSEHNSHQFCLYQYAQYHVLYSVVTFRTCNHVTLRICHYTTCYYVFMVTLFDIQHFCQQWYSVLLWTVTLSVNMTSDS